MRCFRFLEFWNSSLVLHLSESWKVPPLSWGWRWNSGINLFLEVKFCFFLTQNTKKVIWLMKIHQKRIDTFGSNFLFLLTFRIVQRVYNKTLSGGQFLVFYWKTFNCLIGIFVFNKIFFRFSYICNSDPIKFSDHSCRCGVLPFESIRRHLPASTADLIAHFC